MPLKLIFDNLIIPIHIIEEKYEGGFHEFYSLIRNEVHYFDEHLFTISSMSFEMLFYNVIEMLNSKGLNCYDLDKDKNIISGDSEKIKTVLIVQPILGTGNKTLSTDESLMVPKLDEQKIPLKILDSFANELPTLGKYCDKTIDLRNIFDDTVEPIYFDLGHPTDKGNKIVAEKIYEIIFPIIVEDIQNPS